MSEMVHYNKIKLKFHVPKLQKQWDRSMSIANVYANKSAQKVMQIVQYL